MSARVLVVDDLPVNVKLLEAKLLVEYYDVITAGDGPSAIQAVIDQAPDIVLLDVMMPGMDGYEVCTALKADPITAHVPVVMVTALNETRDRVRGLEAGADDFLTKPVNDVALFARIRSLVRLKRASDEWRAREATAVELGVTGATLDSVDEKAPGRILVAINGLWEHEKTVETLRGQGHHVELAENDTETLSMAVDCDYELVVLGDSDSDGDGDALRACSQLRSNAETRHIPILMIVPDGDEPRLAKALELGVNDYLVRPIDRDELIARTRTQIRRRRYEERLRENFAASVNAAVTDSLTGMYNRRYLKSHFQRLSRRLRGSTKPLSLMVLDADRFKEVNDIWGHNIGDEVLQEIARRIQSNLRGFDTAVRYGGEEFVVLLPDTPIAAAATAAERICGLIAATPIPISADPAGLPVTVSLGVAAAVDTLDLDDLIKRADDAMYRAKQEGRNRVVIDRDHDPLIALGAAG
ncbi:MAG: PleD family two-component system response regulator [Alphaproteobacteria bacterium]